MSKTLPVAIELPEREVLTMDEAEVAALI